MYLKLLTNECQIRELYVLSPQPFPSENWCYGLSVANSENKQGRCPSFMHSFLHDTYIRVYKYTGVFVQGIYICILFTSTCAHSHTNICSNTPTHSHTYICREGERVRVYGHTHGDAYKGCWYIRCTLPSGTPRTFSSTSALGAKQPPKHALCPVPPV